MKILYITLFVIFVDQVSKLFVKGFSIPFLNLFHEGIDLNSSIVIIEDVLKIAHVENPGMAFGFDIGGKLFLALFRLIAAIGILYFIYRIRTHKFLLRFPLALILGGAIGNLIDRIFYGVLYNEAPLFYGNVVDFIYLSFVKIDFWGIHLNGWPIFNISDIAITLGVLILIIFHKKITSVKETKLLTQNPVSTEIDFTESDRNYSLSSEYQN